MSSSSEPRAWTDVKDTKPENIAPELREKWLRWMLYISLQGAARAFSTYASWKRSGVFMSFAEACAAGATALKSPHVYADDTSK